MYTATIIQEDDIYVATCLEYDIVSQGGTVEDALSNLREAMELYLESVVIVDQVIVKPHSVFVTNFTLSTPTHASYSIA